jgi:TIGR03118 family protein
MSKKNEEKFCKCNFFEPKNLQSDIGFVANYTDSNLVNPWGIVIRHKVIYVANNGGDGATAGTVTRYNLCGLPISGNTLSVEGRPTGLVVNKGNGFQISNGTTQPSKIIVATEEGTLLGFNEAISSTSFVPITITAPDEMTTPSYVGIAMSCDDLYLYATDIANQNIVKFDSSATIVSTFTDPVLVAQNYAPYGITVIKKYVYVSFVQIDPENPLTPVPGIGHGYIDIFCATTGSLLRRFTSRGPLNNPTGLLRCKEKLLVANNGDGRILTYNLCSGDFLGALKYCEAPSDPIIVDGVKNLALSSCNNKIYYTQGIENGENYNGILGVLKH